MELYRIPTAVEMTKLCTDFTTTLVYILVPTCFGNSLLSSGSFLNPSELLEIQIECVMYRKYVTDKRISMYNIFCRIKHTEWHNNKRYTVS
jgi:hypothetical protein